MTTLAGSALHQSDPSHTGLFAVLLGAAWVLVRFARRRYSFQTLGQKNPFGAMLVDGLVLTALASLAHALLGIDSSNSASTIPLWLGVLSSYIAQEVLRWSRRRKWRQGLDRSTTLLVGPSRDIVHLFSAMRRGNAQQFKVAGACLSDPENAAEVRDAGLPVLGGTDRIDDVIHALGISSLVTLPIPGADPAVLRRMSWSAAVQDVDFLLAPVLTDVSASRLEVRPTDGVPLIRIKRPDISRVSRLPKELMDRTLAASLLLMLALPMLLIALTIRLDSSGPALSRTRRVGRFGDQFTMLKFRTMRADSEALRAELAEHLHLNNRAGMVFKLPRDPRITRVGSFLRRTSLDELPQLINVLGGHMSLVGPRPPLPEEVEEYAPEVKRRLLVKPGLTGLWQVSGRSDLSWDEAVRLDLYYVDNWSMALDLSILARTGSAVVRGTGAY
ncbi:sugar transferase [Streptomyces sp. NPDC001536]|uniref:sugar transferase n=1 Tax=Streptomyces sp. NPDC001536 TaxID=3364583 RepID=UPI00369E3F4F